MKNTLKESKLKIQQVPIKDLKMASYNPRRWDEQAIKHLKESITRFGLVDPVIVNVAPKRKNVLIGGHFRANVAREIGYKTVPAVFVNIPSLKKEKELNLRLNRNTGDWDFDLLREFDNNFLLDVGFDDSDLSAIWDDALEVENDDFDVEETLQEIKKPRTKPSDMYQLGTHRLICGDSTDAQVVKKLMSTTKAHILYTDPPYNISLDYNKGIGTRGKYGGLQTNDNKSLEEYRDFLLQTITNGLQVSHQDCHVFYYCDENYIGTIQSLFEESELVNKRVCLWLKNNQTPTPQVAFNKAYEPCVYATRGTPYLNNNVLNLNEVLNKEVGSGNRLTDDILDLFNIWLVKRLPGQEYSHPTEKPATLHEKALRRCTKSGDIILDLFGGSGSTLVACEQLKRRCYMVELEPVFCDLIVRRYEKLTGDTAKLLTR